jgi:hypothetical protein
VTCRAWRTPRRSIRSGPRSADRNGRRMRDERRAR